MQYWLFKSEPDDYSFDDLKNDTNQTTLWDGIRNYQARNILRDQVKMNDYVLFYHSSCKNVGIVGIAQVVKTAYPDPSQFDTNSKYYDEKSTTDSPRWVSVDIQYVKPLNKMLTLAEIKKLEQFNDMVLVNRGRLSIQPVSESEWTEVLKLTKTELNT